MKKLLVSLILGMSLAGQVNAAFFFYGPLPQNMSTTITNAYSGNSYSLNGEYYVDDSIFVGTPEEDTLVFTVENEFFTIDQGGAAAISDIETLVLTNGNDIINLSSQTHSLSGVTFYGGNGDDVLWGNIGNDFLNGNSGNNILEGGPGNDTYIFSNGSNNPANLDTIFETNDSDINSILVSDSSFLSVSDSDLLFSISGYDLEIEVGSYGSILVKDQFISNQSGIDELVFTNVSTGNVETIDLRSLAASPVPVPAEVWLFGSGMIGLIGVAKRKKSA